MSMRGVNLIPAPRQQVIARRRRLRRWTASVIGYAVFLMIGCAVCAAAISADSDETSQALDKATRQIEELNHTAATLRPQLMEAQTRLAVARLVGDQPDWSLLLALVGESLDDEVVLNATKLEPSASVPVSSPSPTTRSAAKNGLKNDPLAPPDTLILTLQGLARSQAAVTQFVLRLERLHLFDRVTMLNSSRQSVGSGETTVFRIECVLRRTGGPKSAFSGQLSTGGNSR